MVESCPKDRVTGMKKLLTLVVVLILVGTASWAESNVGTGQWLHKLWESYQRQDRHAGTPSDVEKASQYMGFVMGAAAVLDDSEWVNLENTTYEEWFVVVGKYLDDNSDEWDKDAEVSVYKALQATWPGKKAPPWIEELR